MNTICVRYLVEMISDINADKPNVRAGRQFMNAKYFVIVAAIAAVLVGANAIATAESVFGVERVQSDNTTD